MANQVELKTEVYNAILKKELRMKIAQQTNLSEQSIRLWVIKKDLRLLSYPIVKILATELKCSIDELIKF